MGYRGGYIVSNFEFYNCSVKKANRSGHLWKNSRRLKVGLMPTVLLANTENNIREEFLTPHSYPVKPLIDDMKAADT